jgi:hypothetical protein
MKVEFKDRNGKDLEIGQKVQSVDPTNQMRDGVITKLKAFTDKKHNLRVLAVVRWVTISRWLSYLTNEPREREVEHYGSFNPTNLEVVDSVD